MNGFSRTKSLLFLLLALTLLSAWGCTPRSYLIVDYQVPSGAAPLAGQQVRLMVNDLRTDPYILEPSVARQFKGFKDLYSLSWVTKDKNRTFVGEYGLQRLFKAAFQKRLEVLGVTVVADDQTQAPIFQVDIQELKIGEQDHNWIAHMAYTASLSNNDQRIALDKVKGSAQQLKIIGRKGADNTLSDLFSDIINRLNIMNLFRQAGLIQG